MYRMILEKIYLEEVINPHYAFPIAGVILCALLVFAFGFKTPAQPPSFDFVDVQHRKATSKKKQKSKEKQQNKLVQNGAVQNQSSLPETTDSKNQSSEKSDIKPTLKSKEAKEKHTQPAKIISKAVPSKSLPTKAQAINGQQQQKSEGKGKNKKLAKGTTSNKAKETEDAPPADEPVGDGWAQILSRKEKKNRKKDEVINTEVEKPLTPDTSSAKKKKKKVTEDAGQEPIEIPPKPVESAETKSQAQDVESPSTAKKKSGNKAEDNSKSDASAKKAKASSVKPSEAVVKPNKPEKAETPEKSPEKIDSPKSRPIDEKPVKNETSGQIKESGKADENTQNADVTNVVFDELGDMWQDAKPQKKKKKARRD